RVRLISLGSRSPKLAVPGPVWPPAPGVVGMGPPMGMFARWVCGAVWAWLLMVAICVRISPMRATARSKLTWTSQARLGTCSGPEHVLTDLVQYHGLGGQILLHLFLVKLLLQLLKRLCVLAGLIQRPGGHDRVFLGHLGGRCGFLCHG